MSLGDDTTVLDQLYSLVQIKTQSLINTGSPHQYNSRGLNTWSIGHLTLWYLFFINKIMWLGSEVKTGRESYLFL